MLSRLALGNVRKSLRDYTVYFVTLVLGVAVFYAFNTIADQADFLSEDSRDMVRTVAVVLRFVTVFLAVVLGFLMVYANSYLVRRRKQELGLYQLLGMTRSQVSLVLFLETVMASSAAFLFGLALGVLLSQVLVFVTAALFNDTVTNFGFRLSGEAALFTFACFVIVFAVMLVFNLRTLHKVCLVDLMGASRENERMRVRGLPVTVAGTVAGLGLIGWAYARLMRDGFPIEPSTHPYEGFFLTTAMVTVGTLVLFYTLSGLLLHVARAFRGSYYRGLNMFTVRQLASKVNTVSLSMGMIAMMLFLAMTSVSGGLGICAGIADEIETRNPYDASLTIFPGWDSSETPVEHDVDALLSDHDIDFGAIADEVVMVRSYDTSEVEGGRGLTVGALARGAGVEIAPGNDLVNRYLDNSLGLVSESDYNALRDRAGLDPVDLGDGGYLITCNAGDRLRSFYGDVLSFGVPLSLGGRILVPASHEVDDGISSQVMNGSYNTGTLVVPDEALVGAVPHSVSYNLLYSVPTQEGDAGFVRVIREMGSVGEMGFMTSTRTDALSSSRGTSAIISYLAIYVGFVFVIACAAILAIQQLTGAADAAPNYRRLLDLGCPRGMAMRSLLVQTLVFFLLPLVVALSHSVVALSEVVGLVSLIGAVNWVAPILSTAVAFVAVYGAYLVVTYLMARGVVGGGRAGARG